MRQVVVGNSGKLHLKPGFPGAFRSLRHQEILFVLPDDLLLDSESERGRLDPTHLAGRVEAALSARKLSPPISRSAMEGRTVESMTTFDSTSLKLWYQVK
jgi:hypothetical protein